MAWLLPIFFSAIPSVLQSIPHFVNPTLLTYSPSFIFIRPHTVCPKEKEMGNNPLFLYLLCLFHFFSSPMFMKGKEKLNSFHCCSVIDLFLTGRHHNSKTGLGCSGAAETFHGSATTPEATVHLQGCHLTAVSLGVILTRGGSPVRVRHSTVFQSILKSVMSGWTDASGVVALPWNISAVPTQQSLVLELQWRPKWKKELFTFDPTAAPSSSLSSEVKAEKS